MEETLLKIEDAIAGSSEGSVAEWLERIRDELMLANQINLLHLTFTHNIDKTDIDRHLNAAKDIVNRH
jgi:hypothetical protein